MTALLCLHETAASSAEWQPLGAALGNRARLLTPDRLGWAVEEPPEGYRATTIHEQAEDAVALLADPGNRPAIACGAGIGAAIALDLLLGHPELVCGAVLIEPPLLAFSTAATAALSQDRVVLEEAVREGGAAAGVELYLSGRLAALGPGAERLPPQLTEIARRRPPALFAELGAVPGWSLPFGALGSVEGPSLIVLSAGTPPLVREASAALAGRLAGSEQLELPGAGPAHIDAAPQLADAVEELSRRCGEPSP